VDSKSGIASTLVLRWNSLVELQLSHVFIIPEMTRHHLKDSPGEELHRLIKRKRILKDRRNVKPFDALTCVITQSFPGRMLFHIFPLFLTNYKAFSDQL
jgi:hypothetical protein